MERRQAMAASAMGALVLASGVVTARVLDVRRSPNTTASEAGVPLTATTYPPVAAGPPATVVVTRYEDVFDRYVVATPVSARTDPSGETQPYPASGPGEGTVPPSSEATGSTPASGPGSGTAPTTSPAPEGTPATSTTVPPGTTGTTGTPASTTTTRPPTTTTTRPPGVPDDWPADEPIPPMPPGCREPKLEDGGEWNCQH